MAFSIPTFAEKNQIMEDIRTEIPNFEWGSVEQLRTPEEKTALFFTARWINELLNKWNTNCAYITLTGNEGALRRRIRNRSTVAKLHTVTQESPDLADIVKKIVDLADSKFIRAFFIFGFAESMDEEQRKRLEEVAKTTNSYIFVAGVVDPEVYEAELSTLET